MLLKSLGNIITCMDENNDIRGNIEIYGAGGFGKSLYTCVKDITQISIVEESMQEDL
jgi:hypothetical protein